MRNLTLKFIFVLSCAFVFANQTNAQLCGKYTTNLQIKTADDNPIDTAVVQLLPIEQDETKGKTFVRDEKDFSKFSITYFEGHQLTANYKLIISADGFETLEREIKFPHCKNQNFDIRLIAKTENNQVTIRGTVYDLSNSPIPKVKIKVTNKNNKTIFNFVSDLKGIYSFSLAKGKYDLEFYTEGFMSNKIENYAVCSTGNLKLDVTLKVQDVIEHPPVTSNNK